jgi:hypothetical protein
VGLQGGSGVGIREDVAVDEGLGIRTGGEGFFEGVEFLGVLEGGLGLLD